MTSLGGLMKASVDVANLIGPNLVMCEDASKGENKTTAAALGRPMGQTMSCCTSLWGGAWGIEFDWKYSYESFVIETFIHLCSLGSWTSPLARAVVMGLLTLSTVALYICHHCQHELPDMVSQTFPYLFLIPML